MAVLYVTTSGAKLEKEANSIVVYKDGEKFHQFPSLKLDKIVIFGNVEITTPVIRHCLSEGIDMVFLSHRGKYFGRLEAPISKNSDVRNLQYRNSADEQECLKFAKIFIEAKIMNMRVVLQRHSDASSQFRDGINKLKELADSLEKAKRLATIRGIEGSASKIYFSLFGEMLLGDFYFNGRNRRPPRDPINSLLSFGYTLLLWDMFSAVAQAGLDPYLGLLHENKYGRPSIALDLIEEYRPIIVDSIVLMVANKRLLSPADFYKSDEDDAVLIADEARKIFLEQYEKRMNTTFQYFGPRVETVTYRRSMVKQVYSLIRAFNGEGEYEPIRIK
ncbi:MAG: CRISPR-associated endonuclease Cas1 [Actinobacteria bacterium]|nr:CRISPR-associated endonuclease Cas1 [Actinomycetota bacterium]